MAMKPDEGIALGLTLKPTFSTIAELAKGDNIEAIVLALSLSRDQNNARSAVISSIDCPLVFEGEPSWPGIQFPRDFFFKWDI